MSSTSPDTHSSTPSTSTDPLIVPFSPTSEDGFLYLPPGQNDLVIIDEVPKLAKVATWECWKQPPPPSPSPPCFYIKAVPGKGQGMFANRDIKMGELIVEERPLYVSRINIEETSDGSFEEAAIKHLSDTSREKFLGLSNAQPEPIGPLPGRLMTNVFAIDFDDKSSDDMLGGGVYEFICRANQDCVPSTHYHFSFSTFTGRLFATRDIPAKEEISVTYAPLLAGGQQRRKVLKSKFRFDCLCPTCTLPEDEAKKSDQRRLELTKFDKFCRGGGMPSYPMLMDALKASEVEGLVAERAHVLLAGSAAVAKSRQLEMALDWAQQARAAFELIEGPESYHGKQAKQREDEFQKQLDEKQEKLLAFANASKKKEAEKEEEEEQDSDDEFREMQERIRRMVAEAQGK
ncbi:hypothetical protein MNV49_000573 [Pseudohyphozyma bogoriensis]|nr:hypothetical protein MNV49_000573 [Pseudohyphozyma bogoriensis]